MTDSSHRLRRTIANIALTMLAGVGLVVVAVLAIDRTTGTHLNPAGAPATVASVSPGAPDSPPRATADRATPGPATAQPDPTLPLTHEQAATAAFTVSTTHVPAERSIEVQSLDPCPSPPAGYTADDITVTVTLDRDPADRDPLDYAGEQFIVAADHSWHGSLAVGRPPSGPYEIRVECDARLAGSYQRYGAGYTPVRLVIDAS